MVITNCILMSALMSTLCKIGKTRYVASLGHIILVTELCHLVFANSRLARKDTLL